MSDPGLEDKVEVLAKLYGFVALIFLYMFYKDWQNRKARIAKDTQLQSELANNSNGSHNGVSDGSVKPDNATGGNNV